MGIAADLVSLVCIVALGRFCCRSAGSPSEAQWGSCCFSRTPSTWVTLLRSISVRNIPKFHPQNMSGWHVWACLVRAAEREELRAGCWSCSPPPRRCCWLGLVRQFCDGVGAGWLSSVTTMEVNCSLQHRNGSEVNNACVYKAPGDSYLRCRGNALSHCSSLFVLILWSRDSVTPVFGAALEEKQGRRPVKWKAFNQKVISKYRSGGGLWLCLFFFSTVSQEQLHPRGTLWLHLWKRCPQSFYISSATRSHDCRTGIP